MKQPSLNKSTDNVKNFKSLCVTQRDNKYYYPKSIPKERGPLAFRIIIGLVLVLFSVNLYMNESGLSAVLCLYASGLLFHMLLQVIRRIILMCEEYNHVISRYEGSILVMVKDAMHFRTRVVVAFVISSIYCVWYLCTHDWSVYDIHLLEFALFLGPSMYLMGIILHLDCCPLNDSLWVAEDNGLDYGSGMAYSFFHGYLNLVLPKTGTEVKNLKELMQDYEDKNDITFNGVYKLFILIPKSLTCFVSLKNEWSPSIDESSSLPDKVITVAGVQNRVYKNAVYKIISEKNRRYVAAEYATPLKTFKDVFDTTGEHSAFYEKHKKDIILQFYLTLKKVLERTGLNEFCELIYFEDTFQDQDGQTCYYDVGKILLTRVKKIREKIE